MIKRIALTTVVVSSAVLPLLASGAAAHSEPNCSDSTIIDVVVHGQHVVSDYVTGTHDVTWPPNGQVGAQTSDGGAATPGGPGPRFHFQDGVGVPPGASFCTDGANSANAVEHQQASEHVPDVR